MTSTLWLFVFLVGFAVGLLIFMQRVEEQLAVRRIIQFLGDGRHSTATEIMVGAAVTDGVYDAITRMMRQGLLRCRTKTYPLGAVRVEYSLTSKGYELVR